MSISELIQSHIVEAMKARDSDRTRALRMIRAAFLEAEKDGTGAGVSDDRAMDILRKMRKQRVESIEQFRAGNRPDLVAIEETELRIIDGYLPQLADEATTREWVREAIAASGAVARKDVGKVMGVLMKTRKGLLDAGLAKTVAESELPA